MNWVQWQPTHCSVCFYQQSLHSMHYHHHNRLIYCEPADIFVFTSFVFLCVFLLSSKILGRRFRLSSSHTHTRTWRRLCFFSLLLWLCMPYVLANWFFCACHKLNEENTSANKLEEIIQWTYSNRLTGDVHGALEQSDRYSLEISWENK